jgi:hypothetical protein
MGPLEEDEIEGYDDDGNKLTTYALLFNKH